MSAPIVVGGHTRIRPFNTRDTYPEQDLDNDLCQAVVAGNTVYVRGQIGQDLDTSESVGVGDVEAQTEQAMANIDMLLKEAGGRMEHLVKLTIYLVDPRYRETVYRTIGRWTKGVHPISTGLVVSALARPEWLVEVDAIAVIPEGRPVTFSVLATDGNGAVGMAVTSSSPAVAARCIHLRAGVGGVASQNITDPRLGTDLLDALEAGVGARSRRWTSVVAGP